MQLDDADVKLVEEASTPTLATLFKRAQKAGLIKPVQDYK